MTYEKSKTEIAKANRTIAALRLIEIANADQTLSADLKTEILSLAEKLKKNS